MFARTVAVTALSLAAGTACAADPVAKLGWMQGCWNATDDAESGSGEQWMSAAGGTVIGTSRTIKDGKTVAWEFLQIREVEPGVLAYIAQPSGRPATTFKLLRQSDTEFVFENLEHDFPQRIIYRREGERLLHARIEGMSKGKPKGIDFPMKRVSCDPRNQAFNVAAAELEST
ncbi:MAG: DUF6265 family protein [Pseudomonadota bacterium]